jgi:VCBS repeat-containing protein
VDSFVYAAEDGVNGTADEATVTLTVNTVNDAPVATDDSYATSPDTPLSVGAASGVLVNDSDVDLDSLQAVLVDNVFSGTLTLNTDGSFEYTPDPGFVGIDSFTYRARDSSVESNLATVSLEVVGNDPDLLVALPLDEGSGSVAGDISGNGNDGVLVGGASFEANSGNGSAFAVRLDGVDDSVDLGFLDVNGSGLTLATWFNGDSFPGSSNDPRLISKATGVAADDHVFMLSTIKSGAEVRLRARVRVGGATTTLIADTGAISTGQWYHAAVTHDGSTLRLYLDGNEVGSTALSGSVDIDPSVAVAVGSQPVGAGGRYFDGLLDDVHILQRALNASELSALMAVNTLPAAIDDAFSMREDTCLLVDAGGGVLANDSDVDFDLLQATLVDDADYGVLTFNPDGSFYYMPDPDFSGTDRFTYSASDGSLDSNLATVFLTVNPVNDAPVASDDNYLVPPDTPLNVAASGGVLSNDTDVDLDALDAVLVDDVLNGALTLNPDGSFNYTPNSGFTGTDSFTYRASDPLLTSNPATVTILVQTPPTVVGDSYDAFDEDTTLVVAAAAGVLSNDVDNEPPDDLTARLVSGPSNGTLTEFSSDGSFTYVPNPNFNGVDSFVYSAEDGITGAWAEANVTLVVTSVNDAPVALAESYVAGPDTPLTVDVGSGVLSNDSDVDQDELQAVLIEDVTSGSLTLNDDGSFEYRPDSGFVGIDSFTYQASDSLLASNAVTVMITVEDAFRFWYGRDMDVGNLGTPQRFVNVIGNVSDPDGVQSLTYSLNDGPAVAMGIGPNGRRLVYEGDFNADLLIDDLMMGTNQLRFTMIDNEGNSESATVSITRQEPNTWSLPEFVDWSTASNATQLAVPVDGVWSIDASNSLVRVDVEHAGYDRLLAIGETTWTNYEVTVTVTFNEFVASGPLSGAQAFGLIAGWNGHNDTVASGSQPLQGYLPDSSGESPTPFGAIAWWRAGTAQIVNKDAVKVVANSFSIAEGETYQLKLQVEKVATGTVYRFRMWVDGTAEPTTWLTYNATGDDLEPVSGSITLLAHEASVAFGNVVIANLGDPSGPPDTTDDSFSVDEDNALVVSSIDGLLSNDIDRQFPNDLTAELTTFPSHGTLTQFSADGSFRYEPFSDFSGTDTFVYRAIDGESGAETEATVTLTINPVNDAPVAIGDNYLVPPDTTLTVDNTSGLVANDYDVDLDAIDAVLVDNVNSGSLVLNADGSFEYTPNPGFVGTDQFTYRATDGTLTSNLANVALSVQFPPSAQDDTYQTDEDATLSIAAPGVLENDVDNVLPNELNARLIAGPSNGTLTELTNEGGFNYVPDPDFNGIDSFVYAAEDAVTGAWDEATVTLSVNSVNDAPAAVDDSYTTSPGVTLSIGPSGGVLANDVDADQDTLEAVLVDNVTSGSLSLNEDGSFQYTPNAGFAGTDSFTYLASDSLLESDVTIVVVEVQTIASDEFNTGDLDPAIWTFVNPLEDASVSVTGGAANISVPGGSSHDLWTNGINAPRLMQEVQNVDFSVEAKFDAIPAGRFAMTGILIEGAGGEYLRFGFYSDGAKLNLFAALISGGSATVLFNGPISSPAGSLYMRITRNGDAWNQQYSTDGVAWQSGANAVVFLDMVAVGMYAGNAGGSSAPAFTTRADYFRSS